VYGFWQTIEVNGPGRFLVDYSREPPLTSHPDFDADIELRVVRKLVAA